MSSGGGKQQPRRADDWTELPGFEHFSGTLLYEAVFELNPDSAGCWQLNLGRVHEIAELECNGEACGVRLWVPYRFEVPLQPGQNVLRLRISNSMANRMDRKSLPSGVFGPVSMRRA